MTLLGQVNKRKSRRAFQAIFIKLTGEQSTLNHATTCSAKFALRSKYVVAPVAVEK